MDTLIPMLSREALDRIASRFDPPSRALTEIARRIANHFELDVCSVYLLEPDRQHLRLAATMGLNQCSVGQVRMKLSEGLAGLVAERGLPVAVAEAPQHPRFKYFPEAGEDRYTSFLGYPLIESGRLLGVIVVQTIEAREFSVDEQQSISSVARMMIPHVARCCAVEMLAVELRQ